MGLGRTNIKQQKYMAEQIGYNFITNMLLSPSAKMQVMLVSYVLCINLHNREQDFGGLDMLLAFLCQGGEVT